MTFYPIEDWISSSVEVRSSNVGGKGMFAVSPIKEGQVVVVWGGETIPADQADEAKRVGKLVMQWDDDLFTVEDMGKDISYYINHSCDPNIWMRDVATLIARRDIEVGEEITADYVFWEADENYVSVWKCACGSSLCRKQITGKDWRLPELQRRYKGHFSPFINKRIGKKK